VDRNGLLQHEIAMNEPIGLYSTEELSVVFVGSKGSKKSAVHSVDKKSLKIVKSFKLIGMKHPTGIHIMKLLDDKLIVIYEYLHQMLIINS